MITSDENQIIRELIASRLSGHSLPGRFYYDDLAFRADLERIWRRGWRLLHARRRERFVSRGAR